MAKVGGVIFVTSAPGTPTIATGNQKMRSMAGHRSPAAPLAATTLRFRRFFAVSLGELPEGLLSLDREVGGHNDFDVDQQIPPTAPLQTALLGS